MSGIDAARKGVQEHYENCLAEHGPNQHGMDWGDNERLIQRYHVMADIFANDKTALDIVDVGSGAGLFYDYLEWYRPELLKNPAFKYRGIDISPKMVEASKARHHGVNFVARDLVSDPLPELSCDYAVMNGVLTVKEGVPHADMEQFAQAMTKSVFNACRKGMAVNFMTKHVDWEKDRLFHYALDTAMAYFKKELSRHVVLRCDYGLWEYTAYIFREPNARETEQDAKFINDVLDGKK